MWRLLVAPMGLTLLLLAGCSSERSRPLEKPSALQEAPGTTSSTATQPQCPPRLAARPSCEPGPTPAPPLPEDCSPPQAQTVYLQISPDSSELEVGLLEP